MFVLLSLDFPRMIFLKKLFFKYVDSAELSAYRLENVPGRIPQIYIQKIHQSITVCSSCASINWPPALRQAPYQVFYVSLSLHNNFTIQTLLPSNSGSIREEHVRLRDQQMRRLWRETRNLFFPFGPRTFCSSPTVLNTTALC